MSKSLPQELQFINEYRINSNSLERPSWLESEFPELVWRCNFGSAGTFDIDFRIVLHDGTRLSSPEHRDFLNSLKRFICLQTSPYLIGGATISASYQYNLIHRTLHIIDYFLLQSEQIHLGRYHFSIVTIDDVRNFVFQLSSHRKIKHNLYEPEQRIINAIKNVDVTSKDIADARAIVPELFDVTDAERELPLDDDALTRARVWAFNNNLYSSGASEHQYSFVINSTKLVRKILGMRVLGNQKFDGLALDDFNFKPKYTCFREHKGVPVSNTNEDERASDEVVRAYISILRSMKVLHQLGDQLIPIKALDALDEYEVLQDGRTRESGRFKTLPFTVANKVLSKAIEFYFKYADSIVDFYLYLANQNSTNASDINLISVSPAIQELGIKRWRTIKTTHTSREKFFAALRENPTLYQSLEILIGAIAIIVNSVMARRVSELINLKPEDIVRSSDNEYFLRFSVSKQNVANHRERALRPIPNIAVEALQLLARLQRELRAIGADVGDNLFQLPRIMGQGSQSIPFNLKPLSCSGLSLCLDRFCDYIETPTDDQGRRYYIRPHQLRRNFAYLFFWQGFFGGIEVLRYFLGHKKPSFTYRYVTESMRGKALRQVKASVVGHLMMTEHRSTDTLAAFICERYGLTHENLHLLPEEDVISYLEELLGNEDISIEPEFFETPDGESYRIIIKVTHMR